MKLENLNEKGIVAVILVTLIVANSLCNLIRWLLG